jgi:hypothetical protein
MKEGRSLQELVAEVTRINESKRDFIVPTDKMHMRSDGEGGVVLSLTTRPEDGPLSDEDFKIRPYAHDHIAGYAKIPRDYYKRCLSDGQPGSVLLSDNVNHWIPQIEQPKMIRTIDGDVRAMLSNRYRTLDNYDLLQAIMPTLSEFPDLKVASCDLTETKLYLKVIFPHLQGEVKVGQVVQMGIEVSNSEVGAGAVSVAPFLWTRVCANGAKINSLAHRRHHVGRQADDNEFATEILSDEAREAADRAYWLKVRDTVKATVKLDMFEKALNMAKESAGIPIEGAPEKVIEELANKRGLSESEQGGIMKYLIEGGDLSLWGLSSAVTRMCQDVPDYDRATELEALGGYLISAPKSELRPILTAK